MRRNLPNLPPPKANMSSPNFFCARTPKRPRHLFFILVAGVALATFAQLSHARLVLSEGFDGFGEHPSIFTSACSIKESPPSLKSLAFAPKDNKQADVYNGLRRLPKSIEPLENFEFRFKFSFPRDSAKALSLNLLSGNDTDKGGQQRTTIVISQKTASIRTSGASLLPVATPTDSDLDIRPMPEGLWFNALVRSRGKTIELFFENEGRFRKFAQAEVAGAPLLGFNFSGNTAFDLDDIEIKSIAAPLPGPFLVEGGVQSAVQAAEMVVEIPTDATKISTKFRIGTYPGNMVLKLRTANGKEAIIDVRTAGDSFSKPVTRTINELDASGKLVPVSKTVREKVALPDGMLIFKERNAADPKAAWSLSLHSRPKINSRYTTERQQEMAAIWEKLPAASEQFIELEVRPDEAGAGLWLQGRYAGKITTGGRPISFSLVLPANGAVRDTVVSKDAFDPKYVPLNIGRVANPGSMIDGTVSMSGKGTGEQRVLGVPMFVVEGPQNADMGVCRENLGSFSLECDGYLSRTPFDGMPDSFLFSVLPAQYTRAWVLCALEEDPDKNTVLTARITKFQPGSESGRGPAIADTSIVLPRNGALLPEGVRKVGEIRTGGRNQPLYLVEFRMDVGSIQDIQFQEKPAWLDFELLGKRNDGDNFYLDRSRKPSDEPSAVHVFAATLERSPVEMFVQSGSFGNIFSPEVQPRMSVSLAGTQPAEGQLEWKVRDLHGHILESGKRPYRFEKAGQFAEETVQFGHRELGWYAVDFALTGTPNAVLPKHTAFFSVIENDKRKAGHESPYFTWNFAGAHGTIRDINVSGPLLMAAGIRQTHVDSEEAGAPYKLGRSQLPRIRVPSGAKDPGEALRGLIKENVAKYPHSTMALVFHESGGGPFPLEIVGGKTTVDDKQIAYDKAKAEHLDLMARAYRETAPHLKLVVGNSGIATPGLLASLFRAKAPREYFDFLGDETVGMTIPPELSVAKENWILTEVARVFGYGELPVSACYEWKSRRSRHLGLERHAEWNVRDILIAHAWKQPLIPTFGLPDVSNSYYNTVWGDGAFTHNPQLYPKPTYPAVATATQILDCAHFERVVPTGSPSVYALEFRRDGSFVYAFWCARGGLDSTLQFQKDCTVSQVELLGRKSERKTNGGELNLKISEAAVYLSSAVQLSKIKSLGVREFPRDAVPAGANVFTASKMEKASEWQVDSAVDSRIDVPVKEPVGSTSFRRPGKFELKALKDEARGDCLELELLPEGDCPALVQEYTFLRLRDPVLLPGKPTTIGLFLKGNSSWGKVFWEIEDAAGERWLSAGSGGYGCDVYDWPEQAGINFDGWNHLQFPITAESPIRIPSPGQDGFQWQRRGTSDGKMVYPVKITAVGISMPRQTLNLLKMEPVSTRIRLGGLTAY